MEEFFIADSKNFSIKFIFDHIRNIGLCALLYVSGGALYSGQVSGVDNWWISPQENGVIIWVFASFLLVANIVQFMIVGAKSSIKLGKWNYGIVCLILTLWVQASMYGLVHAQVSRLLP